MTTTEGHEHGLPSQSPHDTTSEASLDHNHQFYLYASDAPSSLLIGIQLVSMENYSI